MKGKAMRYEEQATIKEDGMRLIAETLYSADIYFRYHPPIEELAHKFGP